ncbi:MAG: hypothetical protein QM532_01880 [Cyanobium sp. MAG06]|nr:hypothetical protein [Cyanobium sp. MAG06]
MINNTNNTQKIFGNIFDNMSVQQFLDIDRIPRGTDDATMIRVNNGIKGYLGLDAKMPTNILVSEALLFLEIHNNPDKYPEI